MTYCYQKSFQRVETTQEIAKSQNSKVIVIGNGDGDLPIILGSDK